MAVLGRSDAVQVADWLADNMTDDEAAQAVRRALYDLGYRGVPITLDPFDVPFDHAAVLRKDI